ncbi:unnamed protein product, partial [Vitis vinifera]
MPQASPELSSSVKLKYVKLGYQYLVNHILTLLLIPIMVGVLIEVLRLEFWNDPGLERRLYLLTNAVFIGYVHPNSNAVVVSTEIITPNCYQGNQRAMLVPNCLFRMGGAAILLTNRRWEHRRAKYRLVHVVRTHKGADDKAYRCVMEEEDPEGKVGISLSKDLMVIAGEALKTNITTTGPLVLPASEQLLTSASTLAGHVEASRMALHLGSSVTALFGNATAASSHRGMGLGLIVFTGTQFTFLKWSSSSLDLFVSDLRVHGTSNCIYFYHEVLTFIYFLCHPLIFTWFCCCISYIDLISPLIYVVVFSGKRRHKLCILPYSDLTLDFCTLSRSSQNWRINELKTSAFVI